MMMVMVMVMVMLGMIVVMIHNATFWMIILDVFSYFGPLLLLLLWLFIINC